MAQGGVAFGLSLAWRLSLGLDFLREVDPSFPENISGGNWFLGFAEFREKGISTVMLGFAFFGGIVRRCFDVTTSRLGGGCPAIRVKAVVTPTVRILKAWVVFFP
jgi:hypothetical protein